MTEPTDGTAGEPGSPGKAGAGGQGGVGGDGGQGGIGRQGKQGRRGADAPDGLKYVTVALAFLAAGVVALAWQGASRDAGIQANTERIESVLAQARYEGCIGGVASVATYNAQQEALADSTRDEITYVTSPSLAQVLEDRAALYEAGVLPAPDCSKLKPSP